MLGPTHNLVPIGVAVLTFLGYKQTNRQAKYIYIDDNKKMFADLMIFFRAFSKFTNNQNLLNTNFCNFESP